jgi:hypothetical protein
MFATPSEARRCSVTFPSVNVVVAVPEMGPDAVTEYIATNVVGSWNCTLKLPLALATTSVLYDQVFPSSSFTKM